MAEGEQHIHGKDEAFSPFSIMANNSIIDFCRTSLASMAGISAGILGLTALKGFIFYFIASLFMSILICLKAGTQWRKFFISWWDLSTSGIFGGVFFVYILDVLTVLDVFVWNGSCVLGNHSTDDLRYLEDTPSGLVRLKREMRWRKKKSFSTKL